MVRNTILLAACFVSLMLTQVASADALSTVVDGNNRFAIDLYRQLAAEGDENLLISPLSISTALGMTYAGARGQTAEEMAEVLHFTLGQEQLHPALGGLIASLNDHDQNYELDVANRLWGQPGYAYRPEYLATTLEHYGAELAEVDFVGQTEAARQSINQWVEEQTHDKIQDLIPPGGVNALTRLVLTNAVYFHSDWSYQFEPDQTRSAAFHLAADQQIEVPMMSQNQVLRYAETDAAQFLEMPYGPVDGGAGQSPWDREDSVSMVVLLPTAVDGLAALEASLEADGLFDTLDQHLVPTDVHVEFPKFELTDEIGLKDTLAVMGMPQAFSDLADFSGIADDRLVISDVLHKTYMRVDEEGTEAAGATGVIVGVTSVVERPIFRADHPFLFMIRDNTTSSILFMGRVTEPGSSATSSTADIRLQPGDANRDLAFDQFDLIHVLQAGKYMTGQAATWGEGDWDGGPGGSAGNPPKGDGLFNQLDIVAAQQAARYRLGPYASLLPAEAQAAPAAAIPEPGSLLLMTVGLLVLVVRGRGHSGKSHSPECGKPTVWRPWLT
jgi:serpin B